MSKKFNKFSFSIILIFVFILGALTERFDADKNIINYFKNYTDKIYQYIFSLSNSDQNFLYS